MMTKTMKKTMKDMKKSGYVTEDYAIEIAEKHGFRLVSRSEINSNSNYLRKDNDLYTKVSINFIESLCECELSFDLFGNIFYLNILMTFTNNTNLLLAKKNLFWHY